MGEPFRTRLARWAHRPVPGEPLGREEALWAVNSSFVSERVAAAQSPHAPVGVLIALARDRHAAVRIAVAANPRLDRSPGSIRRLVNDAHPDVVRAVHDNHHVGTRVLLQAQARLISAR